ncbi:MAG: sigma-70 family RNA polymerase sigma factor [Chthonomonadales bacterium]
MIAVTDADRALVLRCQANDAQAFNEIVARYKNRVFNYICRMIGAGPDAEDLAQDTFVRAYLSIGSFESRATLNTWLFRIATNLCIDYLRRTSRVKCVSISRHADEDDAAADEDWSIPDDRFEPQQALLAKELDRELNRALMELPEKQRSVIVLFDIEGVPYEEIAHILRCPLGTVKSRLFSARMALRKRLEPYVNGSLEEPGGKRSKGKEWPAR